MRAEADATWIVDAAGQEATFCCLNAVLRDYGYQTWIFDRERRMFALIGAYGQAIYVDPASHLVMVHTAVRRQISDPNTETLALWDGVVSMLGNR